ncbi:MAG: hypothetical protein K2X77_26350 [Candidatus Obscuribacterales bacterium]|jgi:hypothetical protein|nr:hypothetical protein [Candidatus Obscuribacterales bacterium]
MAITVNNRTLENLLDWQALIRETFSSADLMRIWDALETAISQGHLNDYHREEILPCIKERLAALESIRKGANGQNMTSSQDGN